MGLFDFLKPKQKNDVSVHETESVVYQDNNFGYGHTYPVVNKYWDGEKTLGELGAVIRNIPDYDRLRLRSYDAYATKDIVKTFASKYFYWTIGSGLKLQCEPNTTVLKSEGITDVDFIEFRKNVEARFMIYGNSKECDFLKEKNLHQLAMDFFKGAYLGGDTLCIIRYDNSGPNAQFVSGEHLRNPEIGNVWYDSAEKSGNRIEHGIETDSRGKHIAYYVNTKPKSIDVIGDYERVPAYGAKTGKRLAWIISSNKIAPDHLRSVPEISQSLEKINKLDRYTESAVTNAEQAANIVYTVVHDKDSTGESPTDRAIAQKRGATLLDVPSDSVLADGLANKITQETSGKTYNMTPGSKLEAFSTSIGSEFGGFYESVFNSISAGQDIPPEVAMQKYSSNYSASRAAIGSFGYIISIKRDDFSNQFYIPFYKLWLEYQILTNKISAKGYVDNIDNFMVKESFAQCRFIGKNMPHIDPLKEAKSIELMLQLKLISREQASELLNMGSWEDNFKKNLEEEKDIPKEDVVDEPNVSPKKTSNAK
jgi:capsid protein